MAKTSDYITLDYSGLDAMDTFLQAPGESGRTEAIEKLINTEAYSIFLSHHHRTLNPEEMKTEMMVLSDVLPDRETKLSHWHRLLRHPAPYYEAAEYCRKEVPALLDDLVADAFAWLPMTYFSKARIHFLADGMSSGYRVGRDWVCDVYSVYDDDQELSFDSSVITSQLFHILYLKELDQLYTEFWYHYREKCDNLLVLYSLWVFVELIKRGMPHFARHELGYATDQNRRLREELTVDQVSDCHARIHQLLFGLQDAQDPSEFFRRGVTDLERGHFSAFQILGAHMCTTMAEQDGREALIRGLSNPIAFYERFQEIATGRQGGERFEPSLMIQKQSAGSETETIPNDLPSRAFAAPEGATILATDYDTSTNFCVLFRGAGAAADFKGHMGIAHLVEHYLVYAIRRSVPHLSFLKGTTDFHHCLYLGASKAAPADTINDITGILLEPDLRDSEALDKVRKDVIDEIRMVNLNPFYANQEQLYKEIFDMAHPVRGEEQDILHIAAGCLRDFVPKHYRYDNMVVAVSGPKGIKAGAAVAEALCSRKDAAPAMRADGKPAVRPDARRVVWTTSEGNITNCSVGFVVELRDDFTQIESDVICEYTERMLDDALRRGRFTGRCVAFADLRRYGHYGVMTINCQGSGHDLDRLLDQLLTWAGTMGRQEKRRLLQISLKERLSRWHAVLLDDGPTWVATVASENATRDATPESAIRMPHDVSDVDMDWLQGRIDEAFTTEAMYLAGTGPNRIRQDSLIAG